jgi:hypothetical protein
MVHNWTHFKFFQWIFLESFVLETKKGGVESQKAEMAIKSASWESSRIFGTVIGPWPVCEDTNTDGIVFS